MTTVRPMAVADIPAVVRMGMRFSATPEYAGRVPAKPEQIAFFARTVLKTPEQLATWIVDVDGAPVGLLGLAVTEHIFSAERVATELAWWIDPEHRGGRAALLLLQTADAWARDRGAVRLQMGAPTDHVARFYERCGFTLLERHYQRDLR